MRILSSSNSIEEKMKEVSSRYNFKIRINKKGILLENENGEYEISKEGVSEYIQGSLDREKERRESYIPTLLKSKSLEIASIGEQLNEYMKMRFESEKSEKDIGRSDAI